MPALGVIFCNWQDHRVLIDSETNVCFDCCSKAIKSLEEYINLAKSENSLITYSVKLPNMTEIPDWVMKILNFIIPKLLCEGGIVEIDEILDLGIEFQMPNYLINRPHKFTPILQNLLDKFSNVAILACPEAIPYHPNSKNFAHGLIQYTGLHQNLHGLKKSRLKKISIEELGRYVGNYIAEEATNYNRKCTRHLNENYMEYLAVKHEDVVNHVLPNNMPLTHEITRTAFKYGLKHDNKKDLFSGNCLAMSMIANCLVNLVCQRPKAYTLIPTGIGLKYSASQEIRLKISHVAGLTASPSVIKKELEYLKKIHPKKDNYTDQANYSSIINQCSRSLNIGNNVLINELTIQIDKLDYKISK